MTKSFHSLPKKIDIQDQKVQRVPERRNPKPRHSIIKKAKVKDKVSFQKQQEKDN